MLRLLLLRFWPVLLPAALYLLWRWVRARRARKLGEEPPPITRSHWFWVILISLLVGLACLAALGFSSERHMGAYFPAMEEDGKLVPQHWE